MTVREETKRHKSSYSLKSSDTRHREHPIMIYSWRRARNRKAIRSIHVQAQLEMDKIGFTLVTT